MKRSILLSLGLLFCAGSFAQNVKIHDQKIKEKDGQVFVTFSVVADKIKSDERLTLTPILYRGDKNKTLEMIAITGRNRSISDKRNSTKAGIRTAENQRIPYSVRVPYESWMSDVSLRVDRKIERCCTEQMLTSYVVLTNIPIRYDVILPKVEIAKAEPTLLEKIDVEAPFLAPMSEYVAHKRDVDIIRTDDALIIRFRQGKNIIEPSLEDNAKSLELVCKVLNMIAQDSSASVGKIVLIGTASPEGSAKLNEQFAQERISALQKYLEGKTSVDISSIESISLGEDWVGLRKLVEQSNMQYKQEVLDIIASVPVMQGREKQLMDLKWGHPYKYILKNFFPKLRNAGYIRVYYESKPDLNLAKTNQAIESYNKKEYDNALLILLGVKSSAAVENLRGLCHLMLGQYKQAETSLNNAVRLGNDQATASLLQLEKLKAVERNSKQ